MIKLEEEDIHINYGFTLSGSDNIGITPENYNELKGKPQINGIVLAGDLSSTDLKIIAQSITNDISNFQVLTGTNVQNCLNQIDTKLSFNEDYDSILLSLDVLNKDIGGGTELPLSSLQTQLIDGRPSHKAPGAMIYDEFGTIGILDHITGQDAYVTTVTVSGGGVSKNYVDSELLKKANTTLVKQLRASTKLEENVIFDGGTMPSVSIILPPVIDIDFISEIRFTSGTNPTSFTSPSTIKWFGDDTTSGILVPIANSRYEVLFYSDGINLRAIAQKVGA